MNKVVIPLADGFEEIEAVSIIDVLRRAEILALVSSITGRLVVTGAHQISIAANELFEDIDFNTVDMIVLPGGMPGSINLNQHEELKKKIIEFSKAGKLLGAICAAPMVFGQLEMLNNLRATCYPGFEKYLTGAEITGEPTVFSNNILTGKGAGVAIQFALKIVELLKGREAAASLADKLLVDFERF